MFTLETWLTIYSKHGKKKGSEDEDSGGEDDYEKRRKKEEKKREKEEKKKYKKHGDDEYSGDEDAYNEDLNEFDRVRDEAERAQRQAGEYDRYKTWALGAVAYMTRACLHEEALLGVTKWHPGSRHARDRFEPAHVKEAKISVVKIVNAQPDDESSKVDLSSIGVDGDR